jgi:hypothetical protein
MIITYNEYSSTENLYTEFYWNREIHLRITRKCINYAKGKNSGYCEAISMIITYNKYPSTENLYTEFYWNREKQLRITKNCINYSLG